MSIYQRENDFSYKGINRQDGLADSMKNAEAQLQSYLLSINKQQELSESLKKRLREEITNAVENKGSSLEDFEIEEIVEDLVEEDEIFEESPIPPTCIETLFVLSDFIDPGAVVTPAKEKNLKKLYDSILKPIAEYYKEKNEVVEDNNVCFLTIVGGLKSPNEALLNSGLSTSQHVFGNAADFRIRNISPIRIVNDISKGNIKVPFGVLYSMYSYVHITGVYEIGGVTISNVIITHDHDMGVKGFNFSWGGLTGLVV